MSSQKDGKYGTMGSGEGFSSSATSPIQNIPRRPDRSSLYLGLGNLVHAGGPNSLDNFARSWTRAAGYYDLTPTSSHPFVYSDAVADEEADGVVDGEEADERRRYSHDDEVYDEELRFSPAARLFESERRQPVPSPRFHQQNHSGAHGIFGSYGSTGSGIHSIVGGGLGVSGGSGFADGSIPQILEDDMKEREPLLVRRVEAEDGKLIPVIVGQSTVPQTIFNSVNVLVGVGILSLPLGLKHSGWVIGITYLVFSALITNYTAKLLARCLDKTEDKTAVTYADIAYAAYGHGARLWISVLFSLELLAACVALIILFGDSLNDLIPSISPTGWKIVAGFVLTPLCFLPLRILSFSSVLGILCSVGILSVTIVNGLIKPDTPGSLRSPAETHLFPQNWYTVPMSFGLLMSPWGGLSVFPNIYKDMRHPQKYQKGVDITYIFTNGLNLLTAAAGYLMFGDLVRDEITSNILAMKEFPRASRVLMIIFISIIPLTKTPLNARPIVSTLDVLLGLGGRAIPDSEAMVGMTTYTRGLLRILVRVLTLVLFVFISIVIPSFDKVMSLLGSFLCYCICVILPMLLYLKICGDEIPLWEKRMNYALITISSILATAGTIWTFLPETIGDSGLH